MLHFMSTSFTTCQGFAAVSTATPFDAFFQLQSSMIQENVRIATPATLHQSRLLHISTDHYISTFTPSVTRRTADGEDRSVPRISTGPTLIGCMIGYNTLLSDFERPLDRTDDETVFPTWTGCWKIYALDYEHALRPSHRLVPDVEISDEHWLVSYSPQTRSYSGIDGGEFFVDSVRQFRRRGQWCQILTVLVHVEDPEGLFWDQQHHLEAGYWQIEVSYQHARWCLQGQGTRSITRLNERSYQTVKSLALSSSVESLRPVSMQWK